MSSRAKSRDLLFTSISPNCLLLVFAILLLFSAAIGGRAALLTEPELRAKVEQATKDFKDLSMVGTVLYKDKEALAKVDSAYSRLYEFKSANVMLKSPDKLRMEGKLGMVKFEYIINGTTKLFRAPKMRITKKEDYADDPAKLQEALDVGLVTPTLWRHRSVEVLNDPEADENGEVKLQLVWPKGDMKYLVWIDAHDLWLKRFEKRDGRDQLQARIVYSNPKKVGDCIWIPTKVEMFASDGEMAGASEFTDIRVNTGLPDSLFE